MKKDLALSDYQYGVGSSAFFVSYAALQVPFTCMMVSPGMFYFAFSVTVHKKTECACFDLLVSSSSPSSVVACGQGPTLRLGTTP
jgi:hypothetical protein